MSIKSAAICLMLCLVSFFLGGCAAADGRNAVLCDGDETTAYPRILSEALPSHTVTVKQGEQGVFALLDAGNEVETFEPQAMSALESGMARFWYPHYLATAVIAVDRDRTEAPIRGWRDLIATGEAVAYADRSPDGPMLVAAMAYGLEGENFTLESAAGLLAQLHAEKRLMRDAFDAPIVICFDYQAAAMIKSGRKIEIIVPHEGTLTYEKGLSSREELHFSGDMEPLLLSAGYRLPDGGYDPALYPAAAAYAAAFRLDRYEHFNTVSQEIVRVLRRDVFRVRLYTSADGREHQLFVFIYMALVVVWIASVIRRAMQKEVRLSVFLAGTILLGWAALRLLKYQLTAATALNRYLWYGFYLFQLALPLVLLWLAWYIDRSDENRAPPKWLRAFYGLSGVLLALVLSNDLHNWVFRLDLGNPYWSSEYGYGIAFYFVTAAWILPLIAAIVILMIKSGQTPRRTGYIFPLVFFVFLVAYAVGYITRVPIAWESDYTMVVGLFTLLFLETCMRTGLVPVNTKYTALFTHSPLNMRIIGNSGEAELASAGAGPVDRERFRAALAAYPGPVQKDGDTLLFATGIPGGYGLWQEDISSLNRLHEEIAESVRQLRAANAVLAEEEKIKRALDEETAKKQLLTQLENEIAAHIAKLSSMIEGLDGGADRPKETARIALLLCYVKRRCNLFFRERETEALPAGEWGAYLEELAEIGAYAGIRIMVTNQVTAPLSPHYATLFYDLFYHIIAWGTEQDCPHMLVHLKEEVEHFALRLLPSADARSFAMEAELAGAIAAAGGAFARNDLDGAIGIALTFPKGGVGDG